jgi:hypothetical protein
MLASCGTCGRESVYVTSEDGEPIAGAVLVPCETPAGCTDPIYTDACGAATLPEGTSTYSVEKAYFRSVNGVRNTGTPQHVIMVPGWPM